MSRAVAEWIARNDDTAIPARVKDRVSMKSMDCCVKCTRKTGNGLKGEFDHIIPLILGGRHAESNLQLLCVECHAGKSRLDVKLKAKVARVRQRNLGIRKPKQKIKSAGFRKTPPQHSATRPLTRHQAS